MIQSMIVLFFCDCVIRYEVLAQMTITSLCNFLFVTVHGSVDHLSLYLVIVYCPCDLLFLQQVVLWGVSFHQSWLQGRPLNFIQVLVFFITLTHIGVLFCMCQPLHAFIHAFSISHGFCLYHSRLGLLSLNTLSGWVLVVV